MARLVGSDEPPYHLPVFVLTHHARPRLAMQGGTTFHFMTGGVRDALERATEAAGDREVRVGGGASTIRQLVSERLIDELHLAVSPVLLGRGEPLFAGMDWRALGYRCSASVRGEGATHVTIVPRGGEPLRRRHGDLGPRSGERRSRVSTRRILH